MLIEEQVSEEKLIERLDEVALGNLETAAFKALLRLQIFFTGRTHELLLEFGRQAQAILLKFGDEDGILDGTRGFMAQSDLLKTWGDTWKKWQDEFQAARRIAASLPFGALAVRHERLVVPVVSIRAEVQERATQPPMNEAIEDGVFKPQIDVSLNAAAEHLYGDTLNLSDRIWRVDREGREAINNVLMKGIANGESAWNMAKELEQFLGAGQDCPRWTSTRLYGRTASEKSAGDMTGLLSGDDCDGRGVSYKALRLARTEIQKAHALATDKAMAAQPWVLKEQCRLSKGHKKTDECDDVIAAGEGGEGIYEKGTIEYPLHPNCLCFKTAVTMDDKEFTSKLNGWLKGESYPEMDQYAARIGVDVNESLMSDAATISLAVWLFGKILELK